LWLIFALLSLLFSLLTLVMTVINDRYCPTTTYTVHQKHIPPSNENTTHQNNDEDGGGHMMRRWEATQP
jgi:hypothetical protein